MIKSFFIKHWALLGFLLSFFLDQSLGIVEHITPDTFWQKVIYGIGTLIYGYFFTSKYNKKVVLGKDN